MAKEKRIVDLITERGQASTNKPGDLLSPCVLGLSLDEKDSACGFHHSAMRYAERWERIRTSLPQPYLSRDDRSYTGYSMTGLIRIFDMAFVPPTEIRPRFITGGAKAHSLC